MIEEEERDDPRSEIANFGAPKKAKSNQEFFGNWSHDGFPLVWPRCHTCKLFKRPLTYVWDVGWVCGTCK